MNDPNQALHRQILLQALQGGGAPQIPTPGAPQQATGGIPPEVQAQIMALSGQGDENALLQQQMAQADALLGQNGRRYSSPGGAALGALGDIGRTFAAGVQRERAQNKLGDLKTVRTRARSAYAGQLASGAPRKDLGILGIASGDEALGRTGSALLQDAQQQEMMGARNAALGAKTTADATKRAQEVAEGLRKEFMGNPEVKAAQTVAVAYDKVKRAAAAPKPTPANDMALIFAYMKMLDPGSTVREGEYANASNTTSVPGTVVNMYNKALEGTLLNPAQRRDFLRSAQDSYASHLERIQPLQRQFSSLAERMGVSAEDVVLDLGLNGPRAADGLTGDDRRMYDWAIRNRNNPKATAVLEALGVP